MSYHASTRRDFDNAPSGTLGATLWAACSAKNVSVMQVAKATGASRMTVYNWFRSGRVAPSYQKCVKALVKRLTKS